DDLGRVDRGAVGSGVGFEFDDDGSAGRDQPGSDGLVEVEVDRGVVDGDVVFGGFGDVAGGVLAGGLDDVVELLRFGAVGHRGRFGLDRVADPGSGADVDGAGVVDDESGDDAGGRGIGRRVRRSEGDVGA